MRKTLILTLSANRDPWYSLYRKQIETWDAIPNEQTRTVYYVGGEHEGRFEEPHTWHSTIDEHLHNIGRRTVEALEFALMLDDWHYLARPHSSTYVHKRHLVEFVESAQPEPIYGLKTPGPYGQDYLWGGGHYVMSRAVVQKLVANKEQWDHTIMEDVGMSKLATSIGIPFADGKSVSIDFKPDLVNASCIAWNGSVGGFEFSDFKELNRLTDQWALRCKYDPDRKVDLRTFDLLFQNLEP